MCILGLLYQDHGLFKNKFKGREGETSNNKIKVYLNICADDYECGLIQKQKKKKMILSHILCCINLKVQ